MLDKHGSMSRAMAALLVLIPLALEVGGCNRGFGAAKWSELGSDREQQSQQLRVVPKQGQDTAKLGADHIVRLLQRLGFSDDQILELGTDLHNALWFAGAAQVYYGKHTEAILWVTGDQVQIRSPARGTFVYDVPRARFVLGSPAKGRGR